MCIYRASRGFDVIRSWALAHAQVPALALAHARLAEAGRQARSVGIFIDSHLRALEMVGLKSKPRGTYSISYNSMVLHVRAARYVAFRKGTESREPLDGFWLSLGGGSFFSALSCRSLAIERLAKCRCNVLLIIRQPLKPS